jgi:hypothetical protein
VPLGFAGKAGAAEAKPMLMFVQVSEGLKADEAAKTIRLVNVSPHTLCFADRPERVAGHSVTAGHPALVGFAFAPLQVRLPDIEPRPVEGKR